VLFELQKGSRTKDLRLGGCWDIYPWEFALHTRSPLVTTQVTPGTNQGLGSSPLTKTKKEKAMHAILGQLHLSQNDSIESLKDDTCTPKPAKLNAWVYIYYMVVDQTFLTGNSHSSQIRMLLSRNFRELHVYLSRNPCWAAMLLMKIHSPPAKSRQIITDHFLIAVSVQLASRKPFSGQMVAD